MQDFLTHPSTTRRLEAFREELEAYSPYIDVSKKPEDLLLLCLEYATKYMQDQNITRRRRWTGCKES